MSLRPAGWTRQDLVVAAPPLVVAAGALLSALWHGLGVPGSGLAFQPPTLLASALVITGALMGLMGNPLFRSPSWFMFGLSAISFLSVAALSSSGPLGDGAALASDLPLEGILRIVWTGVAMSVAIRQGRPEIRRVLYLFALFLAGEVSHSPVLELSGGDSGGLLVSSLLAVVLLAESAAVAWVVVTFWWGAEGLALGVLVVVLLAHPFLTTWQAFWGQPGGVATYLAVAVAAGVWLGILMALVFVLHRLTVAMSRRVP